MLDGQTILMVTCFILAAYSIIGNDAIQTIGTFLSSNRNRPWWVLWLFTATILVIVLYYGWFVNGHDASYGRLDKFPEQASLNWLYIIPPLAILILTRFGMPVSTTFLILSLFAPSNLSHMILKSLVGYFVACLCGILSYSGSTVKKMMIGHLGGSVG